MKRITRTLLLFFTLSFMLLFLPKVTFAQMGPAVITGSRDFQWPVPGHYNITSCFYNFDFATHAAQGGHYALDIGAPTGTVIVAAYGGTVVESTYNSGWGNTVVIRHDGYQGSVLFTRYSHMNSRSVSVGNAISKGQQVGTVGETGNVYGPHLDFSVMKDSYASPWRNYAIDPFACQLLEMPGSFYSAGAACCGTYVNEVKALYSISPNTPNPIYRKSYWGPQTSTTIRPIVEIENPETVNKVTFAVWTTDNQSDIKWLDANHNGYGSWYLDIEVSQFVNREFNCHAYVQGKNGITRWYVLTVGYPDPVYKQSYWGTQTETSKQAVISFVNPDMVDEVKFAVWTTDNQSDLKWIKGIPNGYGSWSIDFNISDFTNRDFLCHAYVTGKNGNVRWYILTLDMPDPVVKKSYMIKLNESTIRPVAEFSNPDMVEKVKFAIWTTSNQSDIKWLDAYPNGYGSWFYDNLPVTDFTERVFKCHIYVKGTNASEQVVVMPELDLDYVEPQTHVITYYLNGGTNAEENPAEFTADEPLTLSDPSRDHYSFTGWFFSDTGNDKFENGTSFDHDLDLYARWEKDEELTLPAALTEIEEEAFMGNTAVEYVDLTTSSISKIGDRAFKNCTNLKKIYIPDSVEFFGTDIFAGCDSVVIVCNPGSAAEAYAAANGIETQ